ncbi:Hypothetical protein CINCED_3A004373 [Cinara cedri]|uniref:Uncharacterized protein n=1 Tax=Cinara cedri TaxID=506608 RepID=A0A5E4MWH6_9HEMI|nr:Hypothetical protein CINCED_3A004373 [Cinara cedri]
MDFCNKHFHQLIRHLDPNGMLNVPFNIFKEKTCIDRYFKTNDDFQKLDVPWMCEQLITLLVNFDETVANYSTFDLHNAFQIKKNTFIWISQAFIGLIIIQTNSVDAYVDLMFTGPVYKKNLAIDKVPKKKKKKLPHVPHNNLNSDPEVLQNQQIETMCQDKLTINHVEENVLLATDMPILYQNPILNIINEGHISAALQSDLEQQLHIQPIEEFPVFNQNLLFENTPLPMNGSLMNVVQPTNLELQQSIQRNSINLIDKQIQTEKLIDQNQQMINLKEHSNQISNENCPSENILCNQLKRKKSGDMMRRTVKKKPIERNSKTLKNRLKRLAGEFADRPLEWLDQKYNNQLMNHLPLRHATYHDKLNIAFAVLTLNIELEENKKQDDVLNTVMTMSNYLAITKKINQNIISENSIFHQVLNNALPHLSLLPLPEECMTDNSSMWRDTMNEINKKFEDSLKDISEISKIDEYKFGEFKERIQQRVSLVAQRTLIGNDLSHINAPEPPLILPLTPQMNEMLNIKTFTEISQVNTENIGHMTHAPSIVDYISPNLLPPIFSHHQVQLNMNQKKLEQDQLCDFQNFIQPTSHKIDIMKLINDFLLASPGKTSLMFTDLCPIHVTNRKYAILVLVGLLGLHKKGIVKLTQTCFTMEPSPVEIELNIDHFL